MLKEEFIKGLKYLSLAYDKTFDNEQASVWYDFFKEDEFEIFRQAVKRIIPKSKYLPSIAELRAEIVLLTNPSLQLSVDEEWNKVIQKIRRFGTYIKVEELNKFDPLTLKVVNTIGWRRLCLSENIEFERKTFYSIFNSYQKSNENVALVSQNTMTLPELMKIAEMKKLDNKKLLEN